MSEINIQIRDADTFECGGKTWRAVGFRLPAHYDSYLSSDGRVITGTCSSYETLRLIVEEIRPPHRTPTDEDAKRRPACEYRDGDGDAWQGDEFTKLVYVDVEGHFHIAYSCGSVVCWRHCRIPNET